MDRIGKVFLGILIVLLTVGAIMHVIEITQTPASEFVEVSVGDSAPLPLAKDCTVYVDCLCVNDREYKYYQNYVISDKQIVVKCGDPITKASLTIRATGVSSQFMGLPIGGVWIFNDAEKEYLLFFMETWEKDTQDGGKEIFVRLRVKQL